MVSTIASQKKEVSFEEFIKLYVDTPLPNPCLPEFFAEICQGCKLLLLDNGFRDSGDFEISVHDDDQEKLNPHQTLDRDKQQR